MVEGIWIDVLGIKGPTTLPWLSAYRTVSSLPPPELERPETSTPTRLAETYGHTELMSTYTELVLGMLDKTPYSQRAQVKSVH
jgi:hypothetical protein